MKRVIAIGTIVEVIRRAPVMAFEGTDHEVDTGNKRITFQASNNCGAADADMHSDDAASFPIGSLWRMEFRSLRDLPSSAPTMPYETVEEP